MTETKRSQAAKLIGFLYNMDHSDAFDLPVVHLSEQMKTCPPA